MDMREKIVRLVTLMLIVVLGFVLYRAFIIPKRQGIKSLRKNLKNIELQINNVLGEEVALRGPLKGKELEEYLENLILKIPSERDIPRVINQLLTQVGKGLKIDYSLIQPKKLEPKGRYKKLPIELKFSTSYTHFNTYLSQLKALPEVFMIDRMDMRRMPGKPDRLHVHLIVSAFVMPGEVEERAEAIAKEAYPKVPKVSPFKPKRIPKKVKPGEEVRKAEEAAEEEIEPTFILQGIVRGDFKGAIINDHLVYVGDLIEGYRVLNVKENSVVLKKGHKLKILEMKE
jgi:Tfp pilus assembly protein PilO